MNNLKHAREATNNRHYKVSNGAMHEKHLIVIIYATCYLPLSVFIDVNLCVYSSGSQHFIKIEARVWKRVTGINTFHYYESHFSFI